jgi:predicted phage terminase large subunit-like protein
VEPYLEAVRTEKRSLAVERGRPDWEIDPQAARERCNTLAGFIREAWHVLHPPSTPYLEGEHIPFLAKHLEAITRGQFLAMGLDNRMLINIPPGCMKSLLVTVFWPAWEWGPANMPWVQYMATAYRDDACVRDCRKTRTLLESAWYQALWPLTLIRANDSTLENDKFGLRKSIPFGSLTGSRAHRLLIDDPHSVDTAESDLDRTRAAMRFRESVPTRVSDAEKSAIVLIMQRLHHNDLSEHAKKLGYIHVCLPMEFEADRRCVTPLGEDWREHDGDLLFPTRFTAAIVARDKAAMTPHAVAGQFQQRPSPREGGLFKRHWFEGRTIGHAPSDAEMVPVTPNSTARWVRHWDLAASLKNTSARTAGVKMGKTTDGRFVVAHVVTTRSEGAEVRKIILAMAEQDGKTTEISLPQDPGQAGKVQARDYVGMLAGFIARAQPETGDKYQRAEPFSAQLEAGNVYLVAGEWNQGYIDELCQFPSGSFKDQVDASSGAFGRLPKTKAVESFPLPPVIAGRPRDVPGAAGPVPNWSGRPNRGGAP